MKALVCGGRNYLDYEHVNEVLTSFENFRGDKITEVIHGAAKGTDSLAGRWASENNIPAQAFPADWSAYGRGAGPIRNKQMLIEGRPDIVIAFPGGAGTANMIKQAKYHGLSVVVIK